MDLHFTSDEPTPDEQDAVDVCLAELMVDGFWHGPGPRRRQYLLPVLHAIQGRIGWISPGALNYVCRTLEVPPAEAFGVADFYALLQTRPHPPVAIHVCDDIACQPHGAEALCAGLERTIGPAGAHRDGVSWHRSPCLGQCERAPAALVTIAGKPARERVACPGHAGQRPGSGAPDAAADAASFDRSRRLGAADRASPGSSCCAAWAGSIRGASTTTGRPAASWRCAARWRWGRTGWCAR